MEKYKASSGIVYDNDLNLSGSTVAAFEIESDDSLNEVECEIHDVDNSNVPLNDSTTCEVPSVNNSMNSDQLSNNAQFDVSIESVNDLHNYDMGKSLPQPSKKRKRNEYLEIKQFGTFEDAENFIKLENFGKTCSKPFAHGNKTYYRCKVSKRRAKVKCNVTMMISERNDTNKVCVFKSNNEHEHDTLHEEDRSNKVSHEMQKFIVNQRKKNMSADNIIKSINEMKEQHNLFVHEKTPNRKQIYYLIEKNRLAETPPIISLGELIEWCEKHSTVPLDEDIPYVIGFEHSSEGEDRRFRFVISTQRLLKNCIGITQLCVDATYKLNWQGYPFLVVGTVDRWKKFHALAFACCTNETTEDFAFMFHSMIDAVKLLFDETLAPEILIADGAYSIRNAFTEVFLSAVLVIMCFAHVVRNVRKRPLKNNKHRASIMKNISIMNLASTVDKFEGLSKLFIKKWSKSEPDFTTYFANQWLGGHRNWFEGASVYSPSTNNALEGIYFLDARKIE